MPCMAWERKGAKTMYPTRNFVEADRGWIVRHSSIPEFPKEQTSVLRLLTEDGSLQLWKDVVSTRGQIIPRLLPRSHWYRKILIAGPDWERVWNAWISGNPTCPDDIRTFLSDSVPFGLSTVVYVVYSGRSSFQIPWRTFFTYWEYFLHTSDDIFLVAQGYLTFVLFAAGGLLGVGERPLSSRFDKQS